MQSMRFMWARSQPCPCVCRPSRCPCCSVHVSNVAGLTPLHMAVWGRHSGAVQVLLQHGASINVRTVQDLPEQQSRAWPTCVAGTTPLHMAAARGHVEICKIFLKTFVSAVWLHQSRRRCTLNVQQANCGTMTPTHMQKPNSHRRGACGLVPACTHRRVALHALPAPPKASAPLLTASYVLPVCVYRSTSACSSLRCRGAVATCHRSYPTWQLWTPGCKLMAQAGCRTR